MNERHTPPSCPGLTGASIFHEEESWTPGASPGVTSCLLMQFRVRRYVLATNLLLRFLRHLLEDRPPGLLLVLDKRGELLRRHVPHVAAVERELGPDLGIVQHDAHVVVYLADDRLGRALRR